MALVRALALHIPVQDNKWNVEVITRTSIELLDRAIMCCRDIKYSPWTWRMVLPPLSNVIAYQDIRKIVTDISNSFTNIKILIALPIKINNPYINKIIDIINENDNVYSSTSCDDEHCIYKTIESIYRRFKDIDINVYTNFALTFGSWVESPYFPATANISNTIGFSISLRYVDLIKRSLIDNNKDVLSDFILEIDKIFRYVSNCSNIPYLGIDASLSPWMKESVAELIELLIEDKLGSIGSFNAIYTLNMYVRKLVEMFNIKSLGYNEVMLPVAEDSILNERVKNGEIKLRDLMSFSLFCVPGVDMVALPYFINYKMFLLDMLTIYKVKRANIALRIIPTDLESGEKVTLKRFGDTYVIFI